MSDRLTDRLVSPLARASARKRAYAADETNDETSTERRPGPQDERPHRPRSRGGEGPTETPSGNSEEREVTAHRRRAKPRTGTLGGSNRMLSARDVAAILAVPERTVRDKWREWGLPAYRIGKHLRWRERDVYAWIDRQAA